MIGLMKPSRVSRKIKILWFFQCNKAISEKCDRENAILTALEAFYGGNAENKISLNFILIHHHRKVLLKLSKCILLNASGICKFYTCKKSPFWKQSSNARRFCPSGPMDPIFHIWAVVTCTKAWGKSQGDKWLFTFCQKNEPKMMLGLSSNKS